MAKLELVKIDSRGRVVLPQSFRELLGLKENDTAYAVLDEENRRLWLSPAAEENLVYLKLEFDDVPGALAKVAAILETEGVDLVSTESHSMLRGKKAVWRIIAKSKKSVAGLRAALVKKGLNAILVRKL